MEFPIRYLYLSLRDNNFVKHHFKILFGIKLLTEGQLEGSRQVLWDTLGVNYNNDNKNNITVLSPQLGWVQTKKFPRSDFQGRCQM